MQQFVDYIINNWTWLLPIFLSVVESIFIICLKRRPIYSGFYKDICESINIAEKMFAGHDRGPEKLLFVIKDVCKKRDLDPAYWADTISSIVEGILSLPTKKGGK